MSDLRGDLMDIRGIGESKADEVLAVLETHDTPESELLKTAIQAAEDGNEHKAITFLKRYNQD